MTKDAKYTKKVIQTASGVCFSSLSSSIVSLMIRTVDKDDWFLDK